MPRSQLEKLWLAGGGLVGFVLVLIGYFFFISPQRDQTSSTDAQAAAARSQNAQLQSKIDALQRQSADLPKYQAELAQAQLALPSTSGLPDFLRTLQAIGNATLANVTTLSVLAPADVTTLAGGTSQAAPAAASNASAGSDSAPTVSHAVGSTIAGVRVYALPITADVSGTPAELAAFLTQLQSVQPRAVLISQIDLKAASDNAAGKKSSRITATLSLTMQAFVAPTSSAEAAQLAAAAHK